MLNSFLGYSKDGNGYKEYLKPIDYTTTLQNISVLKQTSDYAKLALTDPDYSGIVRLHFTSNSNQQVYLDLNNGDSNQCTVYVNGKEIGIYSAWDEPAVMDLGYFTEGESATVSIKFTNENAELGVVQLYGLNQNEFSRAYETLNSQSMQNIKVTNTKISGTAYGTEDNNVLFLSVPYDKGWHAYINGKKVSIENFNGFMAIKLNQGQQTVMLKFSPQGFDIGVIISIVSIILLVYIFIRERRY